MFSAAMWPTYHGLMRADFQLFDEYSFLHESARPLCSLASQHVGATLGSVCSTAAQRYARSAAGQTSLPLTGRRQRPRITDENAAETLS